MPVSVVVTDGVVSLMASANSAIRLHSLKAPVLTKPIQSMLVWEPAWPVRNAEVSMNCKKFNRLMVFGVGGNEDQTLVHNCGGSVSLHFRYIVSLADHERRVPVTPITGAVPVCKAPQV